MAIFLWIKTELTKTLDGPLMALIFTLFVISLGMLYSSSQGDVGAVMTQAKHFAIALMLMWVVAANRSELMDLLPTPNSKPTHRVTLLLHLLAHLILTALIPPHVRLKRKTESLD